MADLPSDLVVAGRRALGRRGRGRQGRGPAGEARSAVIGARRSLVAVHLRSVLRVADHRSGAVAHRRQHPGLEPAGVLARPLPRHRSGRQRRVVAAALRRAGVAGDRARRAGHRHRARRHARRVAAYVGGLARCDDHAGPRRADRVPRAGAGGRDRRRASARASCTRSGRCASSACRRSRASRARPRCACASRRSSTAARLSGTGFPRMLLRHIAPNILPQLITFAPAGDGNHDRSSRARSASSAWAIPPPAPSWGNMIAQGQSMLSAQPRYVLLPSAALFITVVSLQPARRRAAGALERPVSRRRCSRSSRPAASTSRHDGRWLRRGRRR